MPRFAPHSRWKLVTACALALAAGAAAAQTSPQRQPQRPPAVPAPSGQPAGQPAAQPSLPSRTYNPSPVELATDAWKLESVGLSMFLPIDTLAQASTAGGKSSVQITPTTSNSTWIVNIQTPRVVNSDTTAAEVCDQIVTEHFRNAGGEVFVPKEGNPNNLELAGLKGKLLEQRKTIRIGGMDSERVYFSVPGATVDSPEIIRGLTIFKPGTNQFVVFELVTTPAAYDKARSIYEATVASATFEDPAKLMLTRAAAIAAGQKVLGDAAPQKLKEVIAAYPERWERCYKPSPSGADADATEIGYRRITAKVGPRAAGQIGGNQDGFTVQIESRMLDKAVIIDTTASYFVSSDMGDESWTVQNAIRKGTQVNTMTERGARAGNGMVVQVEGTGMAPREIRPVFVADGYVSRVESVLLPLILLKSGAAMDYGFYSYLSDESTVCYRRETLEQPAERPGLWKLTTKLSDKKPALVSYYNGKGQLLRTEMPDGAVWEPVTPEKLMQLWKSKNLPVEKGKR
ncbi:MAG TPA: hypothetical protein VD997_13990 [Phycisphaerales bacterium]|nr:hypothetical protein [Phycisphaerales bacterium]